MAGDFDETLEDYTDRIRAEECDRVLRRVHQELTASFAIGRSEEEWVAAMRGRIG